MKTNRIKLLSLFIVFTMLFSFAAIQVNAATKVKVSKVTINKKKVTLTEGESITLKTTVKVNPNKAKYKKGTWKSSNKKVATVTSKGKVTAKGIGKATITFTSKYKKTKKVKCTVTVVAPVIITTPTAVPTTPAPTVVPATPTPTTPVLDTTTVPEVKEVLFNTEDSSNMLNFYFTSYSVTSEMSGSVQKIDFSKVKVYRILGGHIAGMSVTAEEGAIDDNLIGSLNELYMTHPKYLDKNPNGDKPEEVWPAGRITQNDFRTKGHYDIGSGETRASLNATQRALPTNAWHIYMDTGGGNRIHQSGMLGGGTFMVFKFEAGAIIGANGLANTEKLVKVAFDYD